MREDSDGNAPSRHLGRDNRHGGCDVCDPRRLRPRRRAPAAIHRDRVRARPDDDLDRAVLGRQRDLAGARRRRAVGRLPAGLCGDHAGALSAGHRDAAGARVSRSGVRIPRGLAQQAILEPGIHARLARRRLLPGRDPRRADPGHPGRGGRLRRRRLRLGHPLCHAMRPRRRRRVRPAGRHLARHEDRRCDRRACARACEAVPAGGS